MATGPAIRICSHCRKRLDAGGLVGRREACSFCGADLHICLNCRFYNPASYNACREPQAERVLSKDRANFCDYFSFRDGLDQPADPPSNGASAKDRLAELFKK